MMWEPLDMAQRVMLGPARRFAARPAQLRQKAAPPALARAGGAASCMIARMTGCRQAVILAAGRGSRLAPLTAQRPKCLVEVGGAPLVDSLLARMAEIGVRHVVLVAGYRSDAVRAHLARRGHDLRIDVVDNPDWAEAQNALSLHAAAEHIRPPFVLLDGDLWLSPALAAALRAPDRMALARLRPGMVGTRARAEAGVVVALGARGGPQDGERGQLLRRLVAGWFRPALEQLVAAVGAASTTRPRSPTRCAPERPRSARSWRATATGSRSTGPRNCSRRSVLRRRARGMRGARAWPGATAGCATGAVKRRLVDPVRLSAGAVRARLAGAVARLRGQTTSPRRRWRRAPPAPAWPRQRRPLLAALLLQLGQVLDSMDGTLARARGQHSALGAFVDRVGDAAVLGLLCAAVGWRASLADGARCGWPPRWAAAFSTCCAATCTGWRAG